LCASLATEVNLIQALSGEAMGRNVLFICTVAAAFTFAFTFGYWAIVLVSLATVPIMVSGMAIEIAMMSGGTDGQGSQGLGVDAGKIVGEVVTSVRTIASFTLEQRMSERFTAATDAYLRTNTLSGALKGVYQAYAQFSLFAAFALLYWFGGSKVADGTTDFEGMLIPIFCMFMLGAGLGQAGNGATDAAKAASAAERVFETVDRQSQIDFTSQEGRTLPQVSGDISLKNIKFAYPARPDKKVCNGYSLEIAAGTTVALVGASGSGKSTIIQLMERFYDPDSGVVTLDGVDLRELNVRWLRQQIGLVGQEPVLFSGTIAENIAYGKPGSTPADVEQAARMANAWDFIQEFPAKFDTDVGEKGGQLSGGQKQRIAIARAMIKNPAVLLLDEATSALDTESERIVQGALDELLAKYKRTTIVIAHRLSTIRNADKIAVVDKGKIVEEGTHDTLMAIGEEGRYFQLNQKSQGGGGGTLIKSGSAQSLSSLASHQSVDTVPHHPDADAASYAISGSVGFVNSPAGDKTHAMLPLGEAGAGKEDEAAKKAAEAEKKRKSKGNVSRVWKMHEGDSFHFFVGTIGAILVGAPRCSLHPQPSTLARLSCAPTRNPNPSTLNLDQGQVRRTRALASSSSRASRPSSSTTPRRS